MTGSVETGMLETGHPFARIGTGTRPVLSIPGMGFTAKPLGPRQARLSWRAWIPEAAAHDLVFHDIGRRGDFPPGTTAEAIADDYAAIIRAHFDGPIGVMGISSGGVYAMWLAIRHPDLVDRLLLGYTGARLEPEARELTIRFATRMLERRWRSAYAILAPLVLPGPRPLAAALGWTLGPRLLGRPEPLDVLPVDIDAELAHDARPHLGAIRCPTLVVSAGRDRFYPPAITAELVAGIPGARHVDFATANHGGGGAAFARAATAFFGEVRTSPSPPPPSGDSH
jgi:pimeloyl-ACP methyl ester carboxylesterase